MTDEYGVGNIKGELVSTGFSREEAYAYMECDGVVGQFIVREFDGKWYNIASGLEVSDYGKVQRNL